MEKNVKLFPVYRLFSCDVLFYYAISIIFLTATKKFSLSEVAIISSVYSIAAMVFQIPSSIIVDKIGLKTSMIIGNIFCMLWGIMYIIFPTFKIILIAEIFCALGFALKGVSETPFLYESLKKLNKISELSKVESKGSSLYYVIEAIASILAGYLYKINEFLPIILSVTCFLFATLLAFFMNSIENTSISKKASLEKLKETISGFKFIFKSKRLHALLLFACMFYGTLSISSLYIKTYLNNIKVSSSLFGYIFAVASFFSALGASLQSKIEKKHKNKTLGTIASSFLATFVVIGIVDLITDNYIILLVVGITEFMIQSFVKGAYFIIIKSYVSRYTTSSIRPKIMSIYNLANNLGSSILLMVSSNSIDKVPIGLSYTVYGFVFFINIILILEYMSQRVGLEPNKYSKQDRIDLYS